MIEIVLEGGKINTWAGKQIAEFTGNKTPGIYRLGWNHREKAISLTAEEKITEAEVKDKAGWGKLIELVKVGENTHTPVILHVR